MSENGTNGNHKSATDILNEEENSSPVEAAGADDVETDGLGKLLKACMKGEDEGDQDEGAPPLAEPAGSQPEHLKVDRFSKTYKMDHPKRGLAIIFNHKKFDNERKVGNKSILSVRNGTEVDGERLKKTLNNYGFKIDYHMNPTVSDIEFVIKTKVTERDHSDEDCLVIAIMTHGHEGDYLNAKNGVYELDMICNKLTAKECPSLAGKPKIFFIQACRGDDSDQGQVAYDSLPYGKSIYFKIPTHADFFLAYSTIPKFVSYRNASVGSWFMKTLCDKLDEEDSHSKSIFHIMTEVVAYVAFHYVSNPEGEKQLPSFTSRLTKDLIFGKKSTT